MKRGLLAVLALVMLASSAAVGAPSPDHVRFTAAGDFAAGAPAGRVLDAVRTVNPDAHFALGDLSYGVTGQEQAWCDFVTDHVGDGFPFELLAGNHESDGQNGNINDFSACLPNQLPGLVGTYGRQYYVDVPQDDPLVRFVMISPALTFPDGTWRYDAGTPRYDWTSAVLDDARASGIPWVVAGIHKPCISLGRYACDIGADLVNLLMAKQVDLVLMGHEHNYQRTHQLDLRPGCAALTIGGYDADCVADRDADMVAGAGTVFQVIGTGGAVERDTFPDDPEAPYFATSAGTAGSPVFGFGDFDVTPNVLSMRFAGVDTTYADGYTLTRSGSPPAANQTPVAAFTHTASGLTASFDASSSSDPDGVVTHVAWDFGDGSRSAGTTAQHTYAAAGTYPVTLTVTDDRGATATTQRQVTVSPPTGPTALATDTWTRTVANGWGTADQGGAWTVRPTTTGTFAVANGVGTINLPTAGGTAPLAYLGSVSTTDLDLRITSRLDKRPTGSGARVDQAVLLRRRSNDNYRAVVRVLSSGAVQTLLMRTVAGAGATLGAVTTVPGLTYAAGETLSMRAQATGTSPTTLRVKVWKAGTPEPAAWTSTAQDSSAALQAAGSVGLQPFLTPGVTNAPIRVTHDDLQAVPASTLP